MDEKLIITCVNCGRRNRLSRRGSFRCGSCKATLVFNGRDDIYIPGTKGELKDLALVLTDDLIDLSGDAGEIAANDIRLTNLDTIDFLALGLHGLDRWAFQLYGDDGRSVFVDELLREVDRRITRYPSNVPADNLQRELIQRINSTQEELSTCKGIYPKGSKNTLALLLETEKSDYLILEFVKRFFPTVRRDRSLLLLATLSADFYFSVQDSLCEKLTKAEYEHAEPYSRRAARMRFHSYWELRNVL